MATSNQKKGPTEELEDIGGSPANNILVRPLTSIPSVPGGGYIAAMGKATLAGELRKALCTKLDVPIEFLSLAYAGRDLDDCLTLRDNGIVEPGAAARRSGARIELIFTLLDDAVPGEARRQREAANREQAERVERQRIDREATQARLREENAALEAEMDRRARLGAVEARVADARAAAGRAAGAQAAQEAIQAAAFLAAPNLPQQQPRPAEAAAAAPAPQPQPAPAAAPAAAAVVPAPALAPAGGGVAAAAGGPRALGPGNDGLPGRPPAPGDAGAPVRDQCVLRCLPIGVTWEGGEGDDPALALETRLSARVSDVVRQLQNLLGGGQGGDALLLVHRGHVIGGRGTLGAAGVEDGGELNYYFAAPGEAPAHAQQGDDEDEAALAAVAAAEAGQAAAQREEEARQRAAALEAQEAQWQAREEAARSAAAAAAAASAAEAAVAAPSQPAASSAPAPADEEEDLYGPAEPSGAAPSGSQPADASAASSDAAAGALADGEARELVEELRAVLARPRPGPSAAASSTSGRSVERLTEAEIASLLRRLVPDVGERTTLSGDDTPVAKLIVAAYRHGPPAVTDAAAKDRLGAGLRLVLAAAREGEKPGSLPLGHRRMLCLRLVEAFQAGPHAQIRAIEVLAEGLAGGHSAFGRTATAMALRARERALDRMLQRLHPEASLAPQQLDQLANAYRQRLGFSEVPIGEAGQGSSDGGLPALRSNEEAAAALAECLNVGALVMELLADVNRLPSEADDRQVDLESLSEWAEEAGLRREVFYDAEKASLYGSRPADEGRPFLHPLAAAKVLHRLLARDIAAATSEA